jgi:hypothetical protein
MNRPREMSDKGLKATPRHVVRRSCSSIGWRRSIDVPFTDRASIYIYIYRERERERERGNFPRIVFFFSLFLLGYLRKGNVLI